MKKYYAVEAKCGHVGKNKYLIIIFPIKATDKKEAAAIARNIPRVKHHHKDAIRSVKECSFDEYCKMLKTNADDPYLQCKSIQDQRRISGFEHRIVLNPMTSSKTKRALSDSAQYKHRKAQLKLLADIREMSEIA